MTGHGESIMSLTQMSENEIVSASVDNTIRVWDLNKLQEENVLQGVKAHFSVDYSPHKKVRHSFRELPGWSWPEVSFRSQEFLLINLQHNAFGNFLM